MKALLTCLCAAASVSYLLPSALGVGAGVEEEPLVYQVDERTKRPLGDLVEPRGVLLDPRDIPERVVQHMNMAAGLEGLEASLTALFAKNIGFALEAKKLPKKYRAFCQRQQANWKEQVLAMAGRLDPKAVDEPVFAAVYHDTGRRIFPEKNEMHVVGAPDIQLLPMASAEAREFLRRQALVGEFGRDMSKERASELRELHQEMMEEVEDPWFHHAGFQVLILSLGDWSEDKVAADVVKMTVDQFMQRCQYALEDALVTSMLPQLPGNNEDGVKYYFEGLALARIAPRNSSKGSKDDSAWKTPKEWLEHNEATGKPMLLLEIPEAKKYSAKSKFRRMQISMAAGGREITLYDGKFPWK